MPEKCVHHVPKHPFTMSAIYTGGLGWGVEREKMPGPESCNSPPPQPAPVEGAGAKSQISTIDFI